ncbi:hypothetical protein BaRGS_00013580 [Batillaria attramentaria]|uniref:N-acetylneuraminate lyase n=1 Tax=Batillaria attramentaria TaxID=370345 RepID=A0ABD0L765_9CAEN
MEHFRLDGLIAATFTPMLTNGEIDYYQIDGYFNGSSGEGPSLTTDERMRLTESWTKHAAKLGVDAVSSLPPLYFPVSSIQDVVDYCKAVADSAPTTPFYYYHIPTMSGVNIPMDKFLLAARDVIPSLRGVKFSNKDLAQMSACVRTLDTRGRNFNVLFGCDDEMMSAMALGADGVIGSTYNFMAGLYRRLVALLEKGEVKAACTEQYRSQDVVSLLFTFGTGYHTSSCCVPGTIRIPTAYRVSCTIPLPNACRVPYLFLPGTIPLPTAYRVPYLFLLHTGYYTSSYRVPYLFLLHTGYRVPYLFLLHTEYLVSYLFLLHTGYHTSSYCIPGTGCHTSSYCIPSTWYHTSSYCVPGTGYHTSSYCIPGVLLRFSRVVLGFYHNCITSKSHLLTLSLRSPAEKTNGPLSTLKAIMSLVGFDVGPARHPMRSLDTKDKEEFFLRLKDTGFLEWRKE